MKYLQVACAANLIDYTVTSHVYLVCIPPDCDKPPRYCAFCRPPSSNSMYGLTGTETTHGGVFIHNYHDAPMPRYHEPVPDPIPIALA